MPNILENISKGNISNFYLKFESIWASAIYIFKKTLTIRRSFVILFQAVFKIGPMSYGKLNVLSLEVVHFILTGLETVDCFWASTYEVWFDFLSKEDLKFVLKNALYIFFC